MADSRVTLYTYYIFQPQNKDFTFGINDAIDSFTVNPINGILKTNKLFDFEERESYQFEVIYLCLRARNAIEHSQYIFKNFKK